MLLASVSLIAEREADRVAIICSDGTRISYHQLVSQAERIRDTLVRSVPAGCVVASLLSSDVASAFVIVALSGRNPVLLLSPTSAPDELRRTVHRVGPVAVLFDTSLVVTQHQAIADVPVHVSIDHRNAGAMSTLRSGSTASHRLGVSDKDVVREAEVVIATSGTTGDAKLVPLSGTILAKGAARLARTLGLGEGDVALSMMPVHYTHGLISGIVAPLLSGGATALVGQIRPDAFSRWLDMIRPTWYSAVPTVHSAVVRSIEAQAHRACFRVVRSAGAPITPTLAGRLEDVLEAPVLEGYALTESPGEVTSNPLPPAMRKRGTVGFSTEPGVTVRGDDGSEVPAGQVGEIAISTDRTVTRYLTPDHEPPVRDGWFWTGDVGVMDEDGYVTITGRRTDIINRGGEKVAPFEVETVLASHPDVIDAVVVGIPHPTLHERVAAAVIALPTATVTARALQAFVGERLSLFKVPDLVAVWDDLPRTPAGKPDRLRVARLLASSVGARRASGKRLPSA